MIEFSNAAFADPEIDPNPGSIEIMGAIDRMSRPFRTLVHEFGYVIVRDMRADGYTNAKQLRDLLETWRARQQEEWLVTDYIPLRPRRFYA